MIGFTDNEHAAKPYYDAMAQDESWCVEHADDIDLVQHFADMCNDIAALVAARAKRIKNDHISNKHARVCFVQGTMEVISEALQSELKNYAVDSDVISNEWQEPNLAKHMEAL